MKYLSKTVLSCLLALGLLACEDKKKENIEKVSTVACQDVKDMVEAHANSIVPILGKRILNVLVKEEIKNGAVCDCLMPSVQKELNALATEEIESMLVDKPKRGKVIKKALFDSRKEVFDCYKSKGLKGAKLIENFIDKIIK